MSEHTWINLSSLRAISRNNEGFVREVLEVFVSNTPIDLELLESHLQQGNDEKVRYFAHKLKSSCFTIGFERGYELFKDLEDAAENNTPELWRGLMDEAVDCCQKAFVEIKDKLQSGL